MTLLLLLGSTILSWSAPTDPLVRGRDGVWAFPDPQGNFTLRARLRAAPGPAPVLRLRLVNGLGYRIALGGPARGRLDDPGRRTGVLADPAPAPNSAPAPRDLDWELSADGPRLSLRLNGQPVWEYVEREPGIRSTGALGFTFPAGVSPQQRITGLELTPRPASPPSFAEKYGPAIGEPVPALRAVDQTGRTRDFASLTGPKGLWVLFFRSADW